MSTKLLSYTILNDYLCKILWKTHSEMGWMAQMVFIGSYNTMLLYYQCWMYNNIVPPLQTNPTWKLKKIVFCVIFCDAKENIKKTIKQSSQFSLFCCFIKKSPFQQHYVPSKSVFFFVWYVSIKYLGQKIQSRLIY